MQADNPFQTMVYPGFNLASDSAINYQGVCNDNFGPIGYALINILAIHICKVHLPGLRTLLGLICDIFQIANGRSKRFYPVQAW
jgi:hypothetical protein